jgi:hypothetical protein
MPTQLCYCSVIGRPVLLTEPSLSAWDGQANVANQAGPVCLHYTQSCNDVRCAVTGLPGKLMGERISQYGVRDEDLPPTS